MDKAHTVTVTWSEKFTYKNDAEERAFELFLLLRGEGNGYLRHGSVSVQDDDGDIVTKWEDKLIS